MLRLLTRRFGILSQGMTQQIRQLDTVQAFFNHLTNLILANVKNTIDGMVVQILGNLMKVFAV